MDPAISKPDTNELYASLSPELVEGIREYERSLAAKPGDYLIRCHAFPEDLIMISSGTVEISIPSEGQSIPLATAGIGKVLGLRSLLTAKPSELDVICLTECRYSAIARDRFLAFFESHSQMHFAIAKILSADLQLAQRYLKSSSRRNIRPVRPQVASASH